MSRGIMIRYEQSGKSLQDVCSDLIGAYIGAGGNPGRVIEVVNAVASDRHVSSGAMHIPTSDKKTVTVVHRLAPYALPDSIEMETLSATFPQFPKEPDYDGVEKRLTDFVRAFLPVVTDFNELVDGANMLVHGIRPSHWAIVIDPTAHAIVGVRSNLVVYTGSINLPQYLTDTVSEVRAKLKKWADPRRRSELLKMLDDAEKAEHAF